MTRQDTEQTQTSGTAEIVGTTEIVGTAAPRPVFGRGANRSRRAVMLACAFLIPFIWLGILRITIVKNGENSQDALYHAMMAKLGPEVYTAKNFPWTQMSVWKDRFADKELLYHAGIDAIFSIEKLFGIVPRPPFHCAALFYSALAILGCLFAVRRLGVRPGFILCGSALFTIIVPNYTFRLSVLRPHVLAIAYLTFATGLLAKGSYRFRLIGIGVLSLFFAWSYSNPHFIAIVPLVFALSRVKDGGWKELLPPVLSLGCVMLGLLVHPQFPNSFFIWKVQSWDALIGPMMADVPLAKPSEMLPPSFGFNKTVSPLYVIAWCNLMMFTRLLERRGLRKLDPNIIALTIFSSAFTVGILVAARSVEYAGPFGAIAFLYLLEEMTREGFRLPLSRFKWGIPCLLTALCIGLGIHASYCFRRDCPHTLVQPLPRMTEFLRENVPAGMPVVNLDWSDFPALFYNDHDHLWQWGMDPMFAYRSNPRRTLLLTATTPGRRFGGSPPYAPNVYKNFHSKYAVLLWPRLDQKNYLCSHGWSIVKDLTEPGREEGWIFALDDREFYPSPGPIGGI